MSNAPKTPNPSQARSMFEAESPDELALVQTAYAYNVRLVTRTPTLASVSVLGNFFI